MFTRYTLSADLRRLGPWRSKGSALVDVKIPSMVSAKGRTQNKRHNSIYANPYVIYTPLYQLFYVLIFEVKMTI